MAYEKEISYNKTNEMTATDRIQLFKYSVILIGIIIVFLLFRRCGDGGGSSNQNDTISVRIDTVWKESKTDTFYTPEIVKTEYRTKLEYKTDTIETFEYIVVDTSLVMQDYFSRKYYEDSVQVEYGKVYINDTVSENKIKSRGVRTIFNIPTIKETIALREKKRNVVYAGFGAMGSEQSFIEQTEISLGLKTKNDKLYLLEAALSRQGTVLIGGKVVIPIRLNNKK